MKTTRTRTDYVQRYHVHVDTNAKELNAFTVVLPPYFDEPGLTVMPRPGKTMNDLFLEALATLDFLRAEPWTPLYPASVFIPFGIITAVDVEDVQRQQAIQLAMMVGGCFHTDRDRAAIERYPALYEGAHEARVKALCRALDLMDGAPIHEGTLSPWALTTCDD